MPWINTAVRAYGKTFDEFAVQGHVLLLFNLNFDVDIYVAPKDHQMQVRGVPTAFLHNDKLVNDQKKLHLETIITDLDYTDDTAVVADSWDNLMSCHALW